MKRIIYFLVLAIAMAGCADINSPENVNNLKLQADTTVQLMVKKDFYKYTKRLHPAIVEKNGGNSKMSAAMGTAAMQMYSHGIDYASIKLGEPSKIIKVKKELQAVIPQTIEIQTANGVFIREASMVAVSEDKGKTWCFIDASYFDLNQLQADVPSLSAELVIPKTKQYLRN
jgi:hypothetical protein